MAFDLSFTEKLVDKTTNLIQKSFASFNKMVFLNEEQQNTLNRAASNFEIMYKILNSNINSMEESINNMSNVEEIKQVRESVELLKDESMKEIADKIASGQDVGIEQTKIFSKNLESIKKGFNLLDNMVSMSFDNLVDMYSKQIINDSNSDREQELHFRSLLVAMNNQSSYLEDQVKEMKNQKELNAEQLEILKMNQGDLNKINEYSEKLMIFSKMGPEELKKNKLSLDSILSELVDKTFETKMYTTFNQVGDSIQSLSVDSEVLNETMNDLTEAQMSGKDMIAGTAQSLKKGAKGMVSSMVLSALGLGGLDEALGISERFSKLDLFGKTGLFGKGGLLSNITNLKGMTGKVGGGLAVAGAGAAGYAFGSWLNKKIDEVGGEKGFLGSKVYNLMYSGREEEWAKKGDIEKRTREMAKDLEGADEALRLLDSEINNLEKSTKERDKERLEELKRHRGALERRKERLVEREKVSLRENIDLTSGPISLDYSHRLENDEELYNVMMEKRKSESTFEIGNRVVSQEAISPTINTKELKKEIAFIPETIHDTTKMLIDNSKKDTERVVEQKTPIIIPPPVKNEVPIDNSKSVDDIGLSVLNSDILG